MEVNYIIKPGDTFTNKDIDQMKLREDVDNEYKSGYSSYDNTEYGLIAENYLKEHKNYTNNPKEYQDVFNPQNINTEIKTFSGDREDPDKYKQDVLHNFSKAVDGRSSLWERKVMWKKEVADIVIFFKRTGNIKRREDYTITYVCDEIFEWNSEMRRYISVQSLETPLQN